MFNLISFWDSYTRRVFTDLPKRKWHKYLPIRSPKRVAVSVCHRLLQSAADSSPATGGGFNLWHNHHMGLLPSGKQPHNYGKSPFSMGKSTISMVIFNSKLLNYQRLPEKYMGKASFHPLAHHVPYSNGKCPEFWRVVARK